MLVLVLHTCSLLYRLKLAQRAATRPTYRQCISHLGQSSLSTNPASTSTATMSETFPEIKSKHSLVAKYVTEPIWAKLSGAKTETSGKKYFC